MARAKLTKRSVESIAPGDRERVVWDTELRGFHVRVTSSGKRTYFYYYRTKANTQRKPAIGVHGELTAEQARDIARRWALEVATGLDPSGKRQSERQSPTVSELCDRFIEEHSRGRNKARTTDNYAKWIDHSIRPKLGSIKISDLSREDIQKLHLQMRATPYQANRILGLLSAMLNVAERWNLRPEWSNPARRVSKYPEYSRQRFLSTKELETLSRVLREVEQEKRELPCVAPAFRLLISTGCRLGEIRTLKWQYVNFERTRLELPDSKTGAKFVYLSSVACEILQALRDQPIEASEFVLPGGVPGAPIVDLQNAWQRIRRRAGIDDVRIHDLRHTFASIAAGLGEGLPIIGKLLGHMQAQTTMRYAHLADNPMLAAANRVGAALSEFSPTAVNRV